MRFLLRLLMLGIVTLLAESHLRADDDKKSSPKDSPEQNRRGLEEKARQDPAWYERMLRDLDAFQSLPADQQERMRQLDKQLSAQNAATNKKLMKALERYVNWLENCPRPIGNSLKTPPIPRIACGEFDKFAKNSGYKLYPRRFVKRSCKPRAPSGKPLSRSTAKKKRNVARNGTPP